MLHNPCIVIIICLVSSFTPLISATLNLPLPSQHPNPEQVVQEVQRRLNVSISRRQLLGVYQKDLTGNPIDDCWKSDPNWQNNRQRLADCGIGFGQAAHGGKGGQTYVVTDSSDINPDNPKQGTLRHAVIQTQPLWIVFSTNMQIELRDKLMVNSFKTIDGRGSNIHVVMRGCVIVDKASNVIIHNIHIHDCVPSYSDGDGITISASRNIWVDHCSLWSCTDGLIDVTEGSTAVTISNSYFSHHDKVMLLGHSDDFVQDTGMQVTVAFNHFGESLVERMPRCRHGYFHAVNNDYTQWRMYAVGGSANPTINSQGNRYVAPSDANAKEVTKRQDAEEKEWANWNWRSDGDLMVNGAFFVPSGDGDGVKYAMASSVQPQSAQLIDQLTMNAGVLGTSNGGDGGGGNSGGWGGTGGSGWGGGGAGASSSGAGTSSGGGAGTGGWEWSDGGAGGGGYDIGSGATPPASVFFSCVVSLLVLYLII